MFADINSHAFSIRFCPVNQLLLLHCYYLNVHDRTPLRSYLFATDGQTDRQDMSTPLTFFSPPFPTLPFPLWAALSLFLSLFLSLSLVIKRAIVAFLVIYYTVFLWTHVVMVHEALASWALFIARGVSLFRFIFIACLLQRGRVRYLSSALSAALFYSISFYSVVSLCLLTSVFRNEMMYWMEPSNLKYQILVLYREVFPSKPPSSSRYLHIF